MTHGPLTDPQVFCHRSPPTGCGAVQPRLSRLTAHLAGLVLALIDAMEQTEKSGSTASNQQATPQGASSQAALDAMASLSEERERARQTEDTPTSNQTYEERSLRGALENWQRRGYAAVSDIVLDKLDDKAEKLYSFPFESGQYVVTARCDADCRDLDLHLLNSSGASAASDEEPDDAPTVSATVSSAGTLNVKVVMAACSAQPCGYALVILRKQ